MSRPPGQQRTVQRSGWLVRHPWRLLVIACCLALVFSAAWVGTRLYTGSDRYRPVAFGETLTTPSGARFEMEEVYATGRVLDVDGSEGDLVAPAGTVYVVVRMQVDARSVVDPDFFCAVTLIGADQKSWDTAFVFVSRADQEFCGPGEAGVVEKIYTVPADQTDRIAGVAVASNGSGRVEPVLLAPPG